MGFTKEEIPILQKSSTDFVYFINNIFAKSVKNFIGGDFVDYIARMLVGSKRTMRVSARDHFKSFSFYQHIMWKLMFEQSGSNIEARYFSFNNDMASYHVSKVKSLIDQNPYYRDIIDCKKSAESVLKYTWDYKNYYTLEPSGLVQFKRGLHPDYVYVDDPFQDPENELNPTVILKINETFKSNVLDMPRHPDGELHVIGTQQSNDDFFFDPILRETFDVRVLPAITPAGTALWPEWKNIDMLNKIRRERTERIFKREYLCVPTYASQAYFDKEYLNRFIVNRDLTPLKIYTKYIPIGSVYAGYDVGKKAHPSAFQVFEWRGDRFVQVHMKIMENWPYSNGKTYDQSKPTQLEYIKEAIKNFNIVSVYYDSTRGEYEALDEQLLLPRQMVPFNFSEKSKHALATALDRLIERKELQLFNDELMINQICSVTEALKAPKTILGHGDSFWAIALAVYQLSQNVSLEDKEIQVAETKKIRLGKPSIFQVNRGIPHGW